MKKIISFLIIATVCILPLYGCDRSNISGSPATDRVEISRGSDASGLFTPIPKDQDQGMILYHSSVLPLKDQDGKETIELYVKAEQANGKIAWDDGQNWYLIVRDGDSIFKLLDNLYVQLGRVSYWSYWDYEKEIPGLLVMVQEGAGIKEFHFTYDRDKDVFYRDKVFQTEGNIGMLDSNAPATGN